ncbi:TPA: hypothetical protein SIA28_001653 [Aeromonas salmonicida]|nr:hypothetical protein [Aeromonas salmonicida]HEH9422054.1 hypothetical protein [Aeromonas salmonicida]HEH9435113.1 hypothetical protein [Aeromonas salmonicida]
MSPEELRYTINSIIYDKIIMTWWQLGTGVIIIAAATYFATYLKKKGENRALKEDIKNLTKEVESVKAEYAQKIEEFKDALQDKRIKHDRAWLLKREACLKALNIANGILSNYKYPNVKDGDIHPQEIDVIEVRECFNELACSCNNSEVINTLKWIMFKTVSPDAIVDLRNAVRRELDFGLDEVDTDRENAFIGRVVGQRSK